MFYAILLYLLCVAAVDDASAFYIHRIGNAGTCSSARITMNSIITGVIVGGGRIGNLLYESNGQKDILVRRGESIPDVPGPIYLATRNNDLDEIINKTPKGKLKDLVFLQNGMLAPYLDKKGLGDNTQGLIYFAVAKQGDAPIDGRTQVKRDYEYHIQYTNM